MANENDVLNAYLNILNRKPDTGGQQFWNGQAGSLMPGQLTDAFRASPEYSPNPKDTQATRSNLIDMLYNDKLNRKPDAAGKQFWNSSNVSNGDLAGQFNKSAEFRSGPGIDWGDLSSQSKSYNRGMSNSPYVFNFQNMPSDPQQAFNTLYQPSQQQGGVAPIRGPNNVNVGPQANDLGVGGMLTSFLQGNKTMAWPDIIKSLSAQNPDMASLFSQLLKPTGATGSAAATTAPAIELGTPYVRGTSDY